ncbi:helix-turn-helix transcriptional regulator [Paenibacillus polymyxa]|uniref:helix-turn-helix transcriptional regulator n=1 Tax=Paenibacillus polymyxa TaxID=1406 RepID=UPI0008CA40EA|nr:YafY family protein [Paenibacillus polymyxa]SEJ36598.1 Predicted DNA-binding transcriptional regulator YafY, contains an HTH and WYL domains [Paenibacillus polymyxa]
MNKTDRLLAILLELQRNDILRAEDLAAIFETSVRTIYRDIQALSESGVPIVGAPGIGYSLMEGYFLPPVSFTAEEAVALLIGADFVEQKFDTDYGMKAQASRRKIEAILPESVRREVTRVRTTIRLLAVGKGTNHTEKAYLEMLRIAVLDKRKVRFGYSKKMPEADGNRQSVRVVAPYGLVLLHGSWVLIGQCELRQQMRHFRLSRMNDLIMLEDSYQLPIDFNLQDYKQVDDRHINVHIKARSDIVDKLKEANHFYMESMEEHADGLHVLYRVRQPEELLSWILGWGADVVVLEPESLRERVRTEVEKMLKCY